MKKQLLKLFNEAGFHQPEMERLIVEHKFEKFAQLIVQDCLAQVDKVDAMLDDPKEKVGVSWVGLAIAKHWGLE
jgi:hypothetical protein